MKKQSITIGSIIKDIRLRIKTNPLFKIDLKKFVNKKQILKLISDKEDIFLSTESTEEFESIWSAKNEFKYFDEKFADHDKAYTRGPRSKSVQVQVYELNAHSWTSAMFSSFGEDLFLLSLTQHEILEFIRGHKEYLNIATFFLYKYASDSDANFHVVQVMLHPNGEVSINRVGLCFECGLGPGERRIVVRQPSAKDIDVIMRS